jgi:hypothetical protein
MYVVGAKGIVRGDLGVLGGICDRIPPLFCGWKINKKPTFILILTAFYHTINTSILYYGLIMQFVNINEHVLNVHPLGTN